jgi:hypothetical protein
MVILQPSFQDAQKKNYTVETGHAGNSYIHFTLGRKDSFGSIQTLFATEQIPNAVFARVALFVDVDQNSPPINPYREIASLHYQLLARPKPPKTIVIGIPHVIGHVAVLSNVSGVFGIDTETVSVAIVHHLVSEPLYVDSMFPYASPDLSASFPGCHAAMTSHNKAIPGDLLRPLQHHQPSPAFWTIVQVYIYRPFAVTPRNPVPSFSTLSSFWTIVQTSVPSIPPPRGLCFQAAAEEHRTNFPTTPVVRLILLYPIHSPVPSPNLPSARCM